MAKCLRGRFTRRVAINIHIFHDNKFYRLNENEEKKTLRTWPRNAISTTCDPIILRCHKIKRPTATKTALKNVQIHFFSHLFRFYLLLLWLSCILFADINQLFKITSSISTLDTHNSFQLILIMSKNLYQINFQVWNTNIHKFEFQAQENVLWRVQKRIFYEYQQKIRLFYSADFNGWWDLASNLHCK